MNEELRCPHCKETRLIERVIQPRWTKVAMWFCQVCAHTWIVHAETQ